jgi:hypothetical protein
MTEECRHQQRRQIWEEEGRPDDKDLDHWLRAEAEIIAFGEDANEGNDSVSRSA